MEALVGLVCYLVWLVYLVGWFGALELFFVFVWCSKGNITCFYLLFVCVILVWGDKRPPFVCFCYFLWEWACCFGDLLGLMCQIRKKLLRIFLMKHPPTLQIPRFSAFYNL